MVVWVSVFGIATSSCEILVYGSHTEQAYSSENRTRDLYARSLTVVELMLMFLWRNPSVLFAFVEMLFIWLSHVRFDCIVTPRYLALSACSSWCPRRVYEYFIGVLFRVMDSTLHLSGWKAIFRFCSHMLCLSRSFWSVVQSVWFYCQVSNRVICK